METDLSAFGVIDASADLTPGSVLATHAATWQPTDVPCTVRLAVPGDAWRSGVEILQRAATALRDLAGTPGVARLLLFDPDRGILVCELPAGDQAEP